MGCAKWSVLEDIYRPRQGSMGMRLPPRWPSHPQWLRRSAGSALGYRDRATYNDIHEPHAEPRPLYVHPRWSLYHSHLDCAQLVAVGCIQTRTDPFLWAARRPYIR